MGTKKFVALCHTLEGNTARASAAEAAEDMAEKGETFYGRFAPKNAAAA